jgi:thiamine pyrophosphokinase
MNAPIVDSAEPVTLVGGGAASLADLAEARKLAPRLVAADGGARLCLAAGLAPEAVIGDMDSLDAASAAQLPAGALHRIAEQDSTDFDKALRSIRAPLVLGVGFLGDRVDHQLAALNRLVARPGRAVILLDRADVICHLPPELTLALAPGARVSLFPMAAVTGRSEGLAWPIDGLDFAPDARVGTSNAATGPVRLRMDGPGMLLLLPRDCLTTLAAALRRAAPWPARAG